MSEDTQKQEISFDQFTQLDIRIAKIVSVEEIEGADRLYKVTLDVGELGERTVAAGIKAWYAPEELVGKLVPYLTNLAPRKLRGVLSQGMILAAGGERAFLLHPEQEVAPGTIVR